MSVLDYSCLLFGADVEIVQIFLIKLNKVINSSVQCTTCMNQFVTEFTRTQIVESMKGKSNKRIECQE